MVEKNKWNSPGELARAAVERHSSIHSTVPPPDPGRARLVASRLIRTAPLNWACACMPGCSAKQSQNCSKTCVFYTINSCNSGFHFCNNVRCNIIRLNTVYLIVMYLKTRIMTSKSRRKKTLRSIPFVCRLGSYMQESYTTWCHRFWPPAVPCFFSLSAHFPSPPP